MPTACAKRGLTCGADHRCKLRSDLRCRPLPSSSQKKQQHLNIPLNFSELYRFLPAFKGKKRLGKVLFRNSIFENVDRVIKCRNGLQYHILNTHDSVGRDLFFDGEYEPKTLQVIRSLLNDGDIMIDAGANIGAISLPVAKDRKIQVYSFEPAKHIHSILRQNIELNRLNHVEALSFALSDKAKTVDFYESDRVHGWSGLVKIDSFQHYEVAAITLDQFVAERNIENIAVLKMDVQGWEYYILKGAERLIDTGKVEHVIFEFEWWAEENAGLTPGTAQQFLLDKGYLLETLDGKRLYESLRRGSLVLHAWRGADGGFGDCGSKPAMTK